MRRRQSLIAFAVRMAAAAMTYVFVVLLARIMELDDFGVVSAILSAAVFFSVAGSFGQRLALLRFVPPLRKQGKKDAELSQIRRAFRLATGGNIALFLLLTALALAYGYSGVENRWLLVLGLLVVPLTALVELLGHLARAYHALILALVPKDILWRLLAGVAALAVFLANGMEPLSLAAVLVILTAVLLVLAIGQSLLMTRVLGTPSLLSSLATPRQDMAADWAGSRLSFTIISLSMVAFTSIDVVIVSIVLGPEIAALYFAANRIAMVPRTVFSSYAIVLGPTFSEHYGTGHIEQAKRMASKTTIEIFVVTAALCAVLALAAPWIMLLFGSEFGPAVPILLVLLFGVVLENSVGPAETALNMCGQEKSSTTASIVALVIGIPLLAICAFLWDAIGVAAGVAMAGVLRRGTLWFMAWRHLHIRLDIISAMLTLFRRRPAVQETAK